MFVSQGCHFHLSRGVFVRRTFEVEEVILGHIVEYTSGKAAHVGAKVLKRRPTGVLQRSLLRTKIWTPRCVPADCDPDCN